ncbi:M1 family metallopeptidase [Bacteroidota bacterium]
MMNRLCLQAFFVILGTALLGQGEFVPAENQFRQLRNELATPNVYRNASGKPGHLYWQQKADYKIDVRLDDANQKIFGSEEITYYNNSPDVLDYLWLQLDQNVREPGSLGSLTRPGYMRSRYATSSLSYLINDFDGGFKISTVEDMSGRSLNHTINYTMMRIDLEEPLKPGENFSFMIEWWYNINDRMKDGRGRSGMEYFKDDDNYIYTIAQFYPRLAVYNEVEGWQNKQFTGGSEFALTFGNFDVKITVPSDHVVAATGELQNMEEVLSEAERARFEKAQNSFDSPVTVVTEEEVREAIKTKNKEEVTWHFKAENVRDYAFATSRRFIWDAMAVQSGTNKVMAMSLYPPEGNPLWDKYSTRVVAHTISTYSKHTFDFPYPVAWSIHTDQIGMEYPMICFNGGRPEPDGTYSERTKWGMIGVIIHEVGHNYFPMIVNSDERQWTWMDEGLNTFLQGLAERAWDHNHPSPKGKPVNITSYMSGDKSNIAPIMMSGDLLMQFGANAYAKPATGLIILRETIMGRELFDFAFEQYAQQWMFKHPTPDDFFRIMEDASAVDLDWFWRGWFYGTDHVDISIENVEVYTVASGNPEDDKALQREERDEEPEELAVQRNRVEFKSVVEKDRSMQDFYDSYDELTKDPNDERIYKRFLDNLTAEEKEFLEIEKYFVQIDFENIGGMIMPLIIKFVYEDGSSEIKRIPAEIWSRDNERTSKIFILDKNIIAVELDPLQETADCDTGNNYWPPKITPNRFEIYKYNRRSSSNPMQK